MPVRYLANEAFRAHPAEGRWDTCIVVTEEWVVLGRLGRKAIAGDSDESVEQAMSTGPSTVRPSIGTDALLERIRARNLSSYLVTTPDGRLVGLVRREDLESGG